MLTALQVPSAHKVTPDQLVPLVLLVLQAQQVRTVHKVYKAIREQRVLPVQTELRVQSALLVHKVLLARRVTLDRRASRVCRAQTELTVLRVQSALRALPDHRAYKDRKVRREQLDQLVRLASPSPIEVSGMPPPPITHAMWYWARTPTPTWQKQRPQESTLQRTPLRSTGHRSY